MAKKKVGCWFSQKKKKKVNLNHLNMLLSKRGVELTEIDLDQGLDGQGPFDAIVHKLTDLMIDEMDGNVKAANYLKKFQDYLEKNPRTIMIDPLHSMRRLLNRYETYKLIHDTKLCSEDKIFHVPAFTLILSRNKDEILTQMQQAGVNFPIMCKKNIAHGSASHKMSIIFNESGLVDVDPPCVAQTFVDHNALLYKIYVISKNYHMVKRPSLINFTKERWRNHSTIFFNSHDISSGDSMRSELTTLRQDEEEPVAIDTTIIRRLTQQLHEEIDMTMFGIDVIVCPATSKHYVIDVNVFPGYDGVDDYLQILVDHIMERIEGNITTAVTNGLHVNGNVASGKGGEAQPYNLTNGIRNELERNGEKISVI